MATKVAKATAEEEAQGSPRIRDFSTIADQLVVKYVKGEDLTKEPPFVLLRGSVRTGTDFNGNNQEQCAFVLATKDGEEYVFTRPATAPMLKMVDLLRLGPIGGVTLIQGKARPGREAPWIFGNSKRKAAQ